MPTLSTMFEGHMSKSDTSTTATSATTSEFTGMNGDNNVTHQVKDALTAIPSPLLTAILTLQSDTSANGTTISAEPHQAPELTTPASTLTNDSGMNIVPSASASATEVTSNPDPMEVDQEKGKEVRMDLDHKKGEEAHMSLSTKVAMVAAPAWMTMLNMYVYLQECSDVKEWQGLVQSLYKFEEGNSINRVCITTSILLVIN